MHHLKPLRSIFLILGFIFISFGCATGKNQVANEDFSIFAEAVPEGILLNFMNIPLDVTHLYIFVSHKTIFDGSEYFVSSYTFITEPYVDGWGNDNQNLDKIIQTGKILFPFVENGIEYNFYVTVYNEHEYDTRRESDENTVHRVVFTNIVAKNGIHFSKNDVKFDINDSYSEVTLFSEPIFSSEVFFDDQRFSFGIVIDLNDIGSIGVGDHHQPDGLSSNGLSWKFEPQMTENLRNANLDWLENGSDYTAWAEVHAKLIYDDIIWFVGITRTSDFIYSF